MKKLMISAGEASGDLHAANMVYQLKKINSSIQILGMGSQQLENAGCELMVRCDAIAVMGIWEVLLHYKKIKHALKRMTAVLTEHKPDLLVLVDYQEFNQRLASQAKTQGVPVLFYVSPQVWAWRPKRIEKIGKIVDHMAVLFPFEERLYSQANIPCTYVGHPLIDEAYATKSKEDCFDEYSLSSHSEIIGLFPGSRPAEVQKILPILMDVACLLQAKKSSRQFMLPLASTIQFDLVTTILNRYPQLSIKVVRDKPYNVMQVCNTIVTASGTATLEVALMGIPSVIVYRVSWLTYWIFRCMILIDHIGLVNIIAEKTVVKEFIQQQAKPRLIADEVEKLLEDAQYRLTMLDHYQDIKKKLGKSGGSEKLAQLAWKMLNLKSQQ